MSLRGVYYLPFNLDDPVGILNSNLSIQYSFCAFIHKSGPQKGHLCLCRDLCPTCHQTDEFNLTSNATSPVLSECKLCHQWNNNCWSQYSLLQWTMTTVYFNIWFYRHTVSLSAISADHWKHINKLRTRWQSFLLGYNAYWECIAMSLFNQHHDILYMTISDREADMQLTGNHLNCVGRVGRTLAN